jgi:prepilin peptidase CpaA
MIGMGLTFGLAVSVSAIGAFVDARTGRIPNLLTLGALAGAPVVAFALETSAHGARAGLTAAGMSLLGAILCGFGPFIGFVKGAIGGGDVKLFAALGALLGPRLGLDAEFYGFLFGALYVPAKLAWNGQLCAALAGMARNFTNVFRPKAARVPPPEVLKMRIRLGPAICLGTIAAAFLSTFGA